jgi:hypothetical protein
VQESANLIRDNDCEGYIALESSWGIVKRSQYRTTQFTRWTRVKTSGTVELIYGTPGLSETFKRSLVKVLEASVSSGFVGYPSEKAAP